MVLVHTQDLIRALPPTDVFVNKMEPWVTVTENGDLNFLRLVLKVKQKTD